MEQKRGKEEKKRKRDKEEGEGRREERGKKGKMKGGRKGRGQKRGERNGCVMYVGQVTTGYQLHSHGLACQVNAETGHY